MVTTPLAMVESVLLHRASSASAARAEIGRTMRHVSANAIRLSMGREWRVDGGRLTVDGSERSRANCQPKRIAHQMMISRMKDRRTAVDPTSLARPERA